MYNIYKYLCVILLLLLVVSCDSFSQEPQKLTTILPYNSKDKEISVDLPEGYSCSVNWESTTASDFLNEENLEVSQFVSKGIFSFPLSLVNSCNIPVEVNISLTPINDTNWKVAICWAELCYMHDGKEEIQFPLDLAPQEEKEFEIKVFVPQDASPSEEKTFILNSNYFEMRHESNISFDFALN